MPQRTIRNTLILLALTRVSASIALAQSPTSPEAPAITTSNAWRVAQSVGSSKGKLFVVTFDQPHRRQTCHVESFTMDKLVCSRAIANPGTYLPQQIVALILPGDNHLKLRLTLGLYGVSAAAIWGTVAFAAICPSCAVATGIAAFVFFIAAGAVLISDDQPDRLLYLAPGQQLTGKLRFVQP